MEGLDERMNALDKRTDGLEMKIGALDAKFESKFEILNKRMDVFDEAQRKMGVLMEVMDGKLSLIIEGYVGHDARIVRLEEKNFSLDL